MSDLNVTTETTQSENENLVLEASVDKKMLIATGVAAAIGAATAGAAVFFATRRNSDTNEVLLLEDTKIFDGATESDVKSND